MCASTCRLNGRKCAKSGHAPVRVEVRETLESSEMVRVERIRSLELMEGNWLDEKGLPVGAAERRALECDGVCSYAGYYGQRCCRTTQATKALNCAITAIRAETIGQLHASGASACCFLCRTSL